MNNVLKYHGACELGLQLKAFTALAEDKFGFGFQNRHGGSQL